MKRESRGMVTWCFLRLASPPLKTQGSRLSDTTPRDYVNSLPPATSCKARPMSSACLLRLLPLSQEPVILSQESALDLLPKLLADQGIPKETTQLIVDAFRKQSPLLERLHQEGDSR